MYKGIQRKINLINFNDFVYREYTLLYDSVIPAIKQDGEKRYEELNNKMARTGGLD